MVATPKSQPKPRWRLLPAFALIILTHVVIWLMALGLPKLYGSLEVHFMPSARYLIAGLLLFEFVMALVWGRRTAIANTNIGLVDIMEFVVCILLLVFSGLTPLSLPKAPLSTMFFVTDTKSEKVLRDGRVYDQYFYPVDYTRNHDYLNFNGKMYTSVTYEVDLYDCDVFHLLCNVITREIVVLPY